MAKRTLILLSIILSLFLPQNLSAQSTLIGNTITGVSNGNRPVNSVGGESSWYLDPSSGKVWGPKSFGTWPAVPAGQLLTAESSGGAPLVILATGQSNMNNEQPSVETWPANVTLWNWDHTEAGVGTAFEPIDPAKTNVSWAFAREVAARFPSRSIYIINISWGGQGISHWLPATTAPDVFQIILNNVPPALAVLGVSQVDLLLWWQGETDAGASSGYVTNFEAVQTRFKAQSWYPINTPIVVYGITGEAQTGVNAYGWFDATLTACVANDPDHRLYVRTSIYPQPYWDPAALYLHMTATGYDFVGIDSARLWLGGGGWGMNYSTAPEYGWVGFGDYIPSGTFTPPSGFTFNNPNRGIITSFTNSASSARLGSQISFNSPGLGNWAIGQDSANKFSLWTGRTSAADGTPVITAINGGGVGLGTYDPTGTVPFGAAYDNPTRAIVFQLNNTNSGANLGTLLQFNSIGIGSWAIGNDTDGTFGIWRSRTFTTDGDKRISIGNSTWSANIPLSINNGTIAGAASPVVGLAQTWNDAAVGFVASLTNITDTASLATSFLGKWQVGSADKFTIRKDGLVDAVGGFASNSQVGLSVTKTIRASGGAADCTLIYVGGILTGGTC